MPSGKHSCSMSDMPDWRWDGHCWLCGELFDHEPRLCPVVDEHCYTCEDWSCDLARHEGQREGLEKGYVRGYYDGWFAGWKARGEARAFGGPRFWEEMG